MTKAPEIPSREEIDRITREYYRQIGYGEISDETLAAQSHMKGVIRRILGIAGFADNARRHMEAQVECERLRGVVAEWERDMNGTLATLEAVRQENGRLRAGLEEVRDCFVAAQVEGLADRLSESEDRDVGSLTDLVERRLMFAHSAAENALSFAPGTTASGEEA